MIYHHFTPSLNLLQFKCLPHEVKPKEYPPMNHSGVSKVMSYVN